MSEVFYRKWRPRRFDQVVGQGPVTQTLRNSVALGRTAHAYLFCGPRGTGKTSTARILAKAVNCLSPQEGEPDDSCEICVSINEARALDLIEIDAASNRGIDDIRNLRDKVHFAPNEARYKVYIVDEAHMLTEQAFNALLKTLEEPPPHAIFVLATTEAHKVPLTIISRCQRFDFRRISLETAEARLAELCTDEQIEAAPEGLQLLARASAGSLRDAENLLEQALVSYGSPLSEDQVRELLELGSDERALDLVGHIVGASVRDGLTVINQVAGDGVDLRQFHRGVMELLRGILLIKSGTEVSLGYPEETMTQMRSLADRVSLDHIVRAMKTFALADLRRDSSSPLPLELALVESSMDEDVEQRPSTRPAVSAAKGASAPTPPAVAKAEAAPAPPTAPAVAKAEAAPAPPTAPAVAKADAASAPPTAPAVAMAEAASAPPTAPAVAKAEATSAPPTASAVAKPGAVDTPADPTDSAGAQSVRERSSSGSPSDPSQRLESRWDEIVHSLRQHKGKRFNLGALLRVCTERELADGTITLKYSHPSHQQRMEEELDDPQSRKAVQDAVAKAMGDEYKIQASVADANASSPRRSATQQSHLVRAAQAMGATVVGEKEEEDDE